MRFYVKHFVVAKYSPIGERRKFIVWLFILKVGLHTKNEFTEQ